jgi:PAT family beta-lactamase induction signal transducer AmpG
MHDEAAPDRPGSLILSENKRLRLLAMFLFYFAQGVPMGLFMFAIPIWLVASGAPAVDVGHVVAMTALPWSLKIIDGFIIDRFTMIAMGRRRMWIIIAQLVIAIMLIGAAALQPTAADVSLLAAIGFVTGFATAFQDVAVDSLAVDIMPEAERTRASSIMFSGQLIGISATTAIAGRLIPGTGPAAAYLLAAVLILLIVLFAIVVRERPGEKRLPWSRGVASPVNLAIRAERWGPILGNTLRAITRWQSLIYLPCILTKGIQFGFMTGATPLLARDWVGWDTAQITSVSGTGEFVAGLIALFIGGWLGEKLGERRMAITFFGVWLIFDALILFAIPLRETGWYPPIMAGGWFALDSMLSIGLIAIAMRLCNRSVAATQFTLYMAAANFGTALGAKLFGMATGPADVERLMLIVMALDALGILILLAVKMTAPPENAVVEAGAADAPHAAAMVD